MDIRREKEERPTKNRTFEKKSKGHESYLRRSGKDSKEPRRMEIHSPCPMCLRMQQGLSWYNSIELQNLLASLHSFCTGFTLVSTFNKICGLSWKNTSILFLRRRANAQQPSSDRLAIVQKFTLCTAF